MSRIWYRIVRYRWLSAIGIMLAPSFVLITLVSIHIIPLSTAEKLAYNLPTPIPNASRQALQISSDPYINDGSQHASEVEPDTYSYGSTIVAVFQAGRFQDSGSSNIGWATSTDEGNSWEHGFLPGTTQAVGGPYTRISDPSVSYDADHNTWIISSLAIVGSGDNLASPTILVNLSTDGGLTWSNPIKVVDGGSTYYDKDWIVCDNTDTSSFYGHCYVEWDDNDQGGLILMSTSTDGGLTWGAPEMTADRASGIGGQPLVEPNGRVIVPISGFSDSLMHAFTSSDGGTTWSSTTIVSKITSSVLPTAEIDAAGKIYLVWTDCQFDKNCDKDGNDLVISTSTNGVTWSPVKRIPIYPVGSGIVYSVPGLGVDRTTSGNTTHLGLAFYYSSAGCSKKCQLDVGFVSSTDGGETWSAKIHLAGPMPLSWLPHGRNMVGDYTSTSFVDGIAFPVFAIASAPDHSHLNEAMYTISGGLTV
jgi:hypothetical protein